MGVYLVGICGGSGSGKSTFARSLRKELGEQRATIISQDSYYRDLSHLDQETRSHVNFDHPEALEFQLLAEHLHCLKQRTPVQMPEYDFSSHTRQGETLLSGADCVIVEGHLIFHDNLIREILDLRIFLEHDIDVMLIRRILRDTKERGRTFQQVVEQYMEQVRPMYFEFVSPCSQWADITIRTDGAMHEHVAEIVRQMNLAQ